MASVIRCKVQTTQTDFETMRHILKAVTTFLFSFILEFQSRPVWVYKFLTPSVGWDDQAWADVVSPRLSKIGKTLNSRFSTTSMLIISISVTANC